MRGFVTKYFPDRGFGFVRGSDGVSRFAHRSQVIGTVLKVGDVVEFDLAADDQGRSERCVQVIVMER